MDSILSPYDMLHLKGVETTARDFLCEVMRQTTTEDRGVVVPADPDNPWPVIDSDVPVKITPVSTAPGHGIEGGAIIVEGRFDASFEAGYDIRDKDRIRLTRLPAGFPSYAALTNANIETVSQVNTATDGELDAIAGIDAAEITAIRAAATAFHDRSFRMIGKRYGSFEVKRVMACEEE